MTVLSPISPADTLRDRFIADMTARGYTAKTQQDYLRTVSLFADFLGRNVTARRSVEQQSDG